MAKVNFEAVIAILAKIKSQADRELDYEQINAAIDDLEAVKSQLSQEQDDAIDMIDEVQDYLEYLLNSEEVVPAAELQAEIEEMIDDLRQFCK